MPSAISWIVPKSSTRNFAGSPDEMITVITEELGEAAAEVQHIKKAKTAEQYQDAENQLFEELSHVAVTAIRAMVQLNAEPKTKTKG